jgi:hypothetical protein
MHEITKEVLTQHETYLFKTVQRRKRGDRINTIANRFRFLSVFLAKNGIKISKAKNTTPDDKGLLDWSDSRRWTSLQTSEELWKNFYVVMCRNVYDFGRFSVP